jgi:hypothetical protein
MLVLAGGVALSATGCGSWNRIQTTQVTVQVSGDRLLHIAAVPRILPDGERPTEQLAALLQEMGQKAGGYTLIENVMGGWIPPGQKEVVQERNDLLLVAGPPAIAYYMRVRLHNDFKQEDPFVISVPLQSIAVVSSLEPTEGSGAGEAAVPAEAPATAEPAGARGTP